MYTTTEYGTTERSLVEDDNKKGEDPDIALLVGIPILILLIIACLIVLVIICIQRKHMERRIRRSAEVAVRGTRRSPAEGRTVRDHVTPAAIRLDTKSADTHNSAEANPRTAASSGTRRMDP